MDGVYIRRSMLPVATYWVISPRFVCCSPSGGGGRTHTEGSSVAECVCV